MVMFPVIFLVILGTKFLFDQLSVSVIERLKRKPKSFGKNQYGRFIRFSIPHER